MSDSVPWTSSESNPNSEKVPIKLNTLSAFVRYQSFRDRDTMIGYPVPFSAHESLRTCTSKGNRWNLCDICNLLLNTKKMRLVLSSVAKNHQWNVCTVRHLLPISGLMQMQ